MKSAAWRACTWNPALQISASGRCLVHSKPVPPELRQYRYQLLPAVRVEDVWFRVDVLLAEFWFPKTHVLSANGSAAAIGSGADLITVPQDSVPPKISRDMILFLWNLYCHGRAAGSIVEFQKSDLPIHVSQLRELSGLVALTESDVLKTIEAVVMASVRR